MVGHDHDRERHPGLPGRPHRVGPVERRRPALRTARPASIRARPARRALALRRRAAGRGPGAGGRPAGRLGGRTSWGRTPWPSGGDDGSVVVELAVTNRDAFRSFVLGLLDHAEVLAPPELRADVVDWLEADRRRRGASWSAAVSPRPMPRRGCGALLALIPGSSTIRARSLTDIAARFGIVGDRARARPRLIPILRASAVHAGPADRLPRSSTGSVVLRFAEYFRRPLSASRPSEGFALLAAGRALLAVPGADPDGPLATRPGQAGRRPRRRRRRGRRAGRRPAYLDELRRGRRGRRAGGDRLLRLRPRRPHHPADRPPRRLRRRGPVVRRRLLPPGRRTTGCSGSTGSGPCVPPASVRSPADRRRRRRGRVQPAVPDDRGSPCCSPVAAWVVETYPTESVDTEPDGRLRVVMAVSGPAWLERLLLRLGPAAGWSGPRDARSRAEAARRVLWPGTQGRSERAPVPCQENVPG